tara:strand:+ start:29 stop:613 length:585 start_codon:yes stop_codon:yes gene_type:complete
MVGLIVCGGKSSRMGTDKSLITYHNLPQRQYLHQLLEEVTPEIFVSINSDQQISAFDNLNYIVDIPKYATVGPMAALLTFFEMNPNQDILIIGCDYPLLTLPNIQNFLSATQRNGIASAFYNQNGFYEPLVAWYSDKAYPLLLEQFETGNYSLQYFLHEHQAEKYFPENGTCLLNANTPEDFEKIKNIIDAGRP